MMRHYKETCAKRPAVAADVNPCECPHCKKIFSRAFARKRHVDEGCPSLDPDGAVGKAAAEARRVREEAEALKKRNKEYHRYVLESREKEKDATGWLEVYKEKAAVAEAENTELRGTVCQLEGRVDIAEKLVGRLFTELKRLESTRQVPVAAGGAGGAVAGRDISTVTTDSHDTNIDNRKQENHFHITVYGTENFDPAKFQGMSDRLLQSAELAEDTTRDEKEIRNQVLNYGLRTLTRQPENRVLKGFNEEKDTVGVLKAPDHWEQRDTGEVAKGYAERIGPKLWETAPRFSEMETPKGEELDEWVERMGTKTVRQVAIENEEDEVRGKEWDGY